MNHSWEANCVYSREVEHPVFGNTVLAVRTARPIARGEELFCNYRYDISDCPEWYTALFSQ